MKKILFFGYEHMHYCSYIREELERSIGEVTYFPLEFARKYRFLKVISASVYSRLRTLRLRRIVSRLRGADFDCVYFVQVHQMDIEDVKQLRRMFPKACFILYYWDSLSTADYRPYIPLFDRVYSFDSNDCARDGRLHYLSLFYVPVSEERKKAISPEYDLSFVGTVFRERRYLYLMNLREFARRNRYRLLDYGLVFSKTFLKYFLSTGTFMRAVHWKSIPLERVQEISLKSRVVVDIPNNLQSGLTMRTFETLGMGRKLVTSNPKIREERCFSPENVMIIDPENIDIPRSFIESPFRENPAIEEYSIRAWVKHQFSE